MSDLDLRERKVLAARSLAASGRSAHAPGMFVVSEVEAAAIRAAFDRGGEFSAAIELRRLFPGLADNNQAREFARTIAGWKPLRTAQEGQDKSAQDQIVDVMMARVLTEPSEPLDQRDQPLVWHRGDEIVEQTPLSRCSQKCEMKSIESKW